MTSLETEPKAAIVTVTCGSCGTKLRASATSAGETIKCTRCGAKLRVQMPSPVPVPSAHEAPAGEPQASQVDQPQDSVVRQATSSQAGGPQSPAPKTPAPEIPTPETPAPQIPVLQASARRELLPQVPTAHAPLRPASAPPAVAPQASLLQVPTPVDRDKPRVVIFPSSGSQASSAGTAPQIPASALSETDLLLSGAGEIPAWTDPSSSAASAASTLSAPPPAFPTSATSARPGQPARIEQTKPTTAARPVPQRTFTDSAIADDAIPEALPRAFPSEAAASRAAVMAAISGAAVSDAAPRAALPPASSSAADEAQPGTRPRYRRGASTPNLPEPIPAMAVLPPQRTAPYLPAATLPPSARRGKAGAIESSGESSRAVRRSAAADAETADSAGASWSKAVVLAAAVVVIGAFAWLVADRIGGVRQWWIVKFACVGWLIGMATATAMLSSGREGPLAKMLSIVAAALAIVLGKALILCLPQVPAELMHFRDAHEWARTFAKLAFIPVDPLFFAMAVTGSTVRFMLSKRDE